MTSAAGFLIVVATHSRASQLQHLLKALRPQVEGKAGRRMVVVNDGSPSVAYDAVIAPHTDWLDYQVLAENCGPGMARQHGCEGATEDLIIFTDDDCVPPPWWVDRAEALARTLPSVDLFGGEACTSAVADAGIRGAYQMCSQVVLKPTIFNQRADCVPTAIMMVRRKAFEAAGGFCPDFTWVAEDQNLTHRIMSLGCMLAHDPAWRTTHHSVSTVKESWRRFCNYGRGNAHHFAREKFSDRKQLYEFYLKDPKVLYRAIHKSFPWRHPNARSVGDYFFRLLRVMAQRRGFNEVWAGYLEKYQTGPIVPPDPGHWVSPLVTGGAESWNRSFSDWRQSRAG